MTSCLNSALEVDPDIVRLYTLVWRPAAWMHDAWWKTLALETWQSIYRLTPHCRPWIDQAIIKRRGFPEAAVSYSLTPLERKIFSISGKLPAVLLALGLLRLGQPEYWMLKPYLEAVQPYLDAIACAQLNLFSAMRMPPDFHVQMAWVEPDQVVEVALRQGAAVFAGALPNGAGYTASHILRALEILFVPGIFNHAPIKGTGAACGLKMLFRLARFL